MVDSGILIYHGIGLLLFAALWAMDRWRSGGGSGWGWFCATILVSVWPFVLCMAVIQFAVDFYENHRKRREEAR